MLSAEMKQFIKEQKLGFVASIGNDGTPNLSPKGTFLTLDDDMLIFAEMRSPNTVSNIFANPNVDVNFVDVFSRKGFRFKGKAVWFSTETETYEELLPKFTEEWGEELAKLFKGIVVIELKEAKPLSSPAYDTGATENDLRRTYSDYFNNINKEHLHG